MAATGEMNAQAASAPRRRAGSDAQKVLAIRLAIIALFVAVWEGLSRSGLIYGDVIPSLLVIARSLIRFLASSEFWQNLGVTAFETATALAIGTLTGIVTGIILGSSRFMGAAFEPYVYYLSPTPRIILFPIMIMWFGIGLGSKIALGALSAFFSIALSTAAGMRGIDRVLIRVGHSFGATGWQMATKIYLPAMRLPVLNGIRLGFGTAMITVLLAETKLSNQGLGFMVMSLYSRFDMAGLYALLIIVFAIAGLGNMLIGRFARQ